MSNSPIYLVTYDRGIYDLTGEIKPYHWSFFYERSRDGPRRRGIALQLHGMPGGFYYVGPEELDLAGTGPVKEQLEIGEATEDGVGRIHEMLSMIPIVKDESSKWNCQDWALEGLERMTAAGYIHEYLNPGTVKNWLKEQS